MVAKYKNTNIGALFLNAHRKKEKAPLLTGALTLDRSLIKQLFRAAEEHSQAKLKLAAWKNVSANGQAYYTITAQAETPPPPSCLPVEDDKDEIDL